MTPLKKKIATFDTARGKIESKGSFELYLKNFNLIFLKFFMKKEKKEQENEKKREKISVSMKNKINIACTRDLEIISSIYIPLALP